MVTHTVSVVVTMGCVLFVTTLLRGFQSRAVASKQFLSAGAGGTLMSACEIVVMITVGASALKMENPYLALWASFGAGAGWVAGMLLHERMVKKRRAKMKEIKRTKRQRQIERIARETFNELQAGREIL